MPPVKRQSSAGSGGDDRVHVVVRIRPPVRKDEKFGEGSEALQCTLLGGSNALVEPFMQCARTASCARLSALVCAH